MIIHELGGRKPNPEVSEEEAKTQKDALLILKNAREFRDMGMPDIKEEKSDMELKRVEFVNQPTEVPERQYRDSRCKKSNKENKR